MTAWRLIAAAVPLVLMAANGPDASPLAGQTPPPAGAGDRVAIGSADLSRYEVMYGPGEFRTLDDDAANWPLRTAIRTVGRLESIPGRGSSGTQKGEGRVALWDNPLARYRICGNPRPCVALVPVEELTGVFDGPVREWLYRNVEVIGAIAR